MNIRKGISPVIATVIIVAVALAIAIAAVGWVMGIWGSVTGGTEVLKIMPDSKLYENASKNVIVLLHIRNEGGASAVIDKIEIAGVNFNITDSGVITAGGDTTITANASVSSINVTVGATYTVKIYTKAGNVYTTQLVAEQAP